MEILGSKCLIGSVCIGDTDTILLWENDPEALEWGGQRNDYTRQEIEQFVQEEINSTLIDNLQKRFMIRTLDHRSIGCVDLYDLDPDALEASVAILIYERSDRNQGYGQEALELLEKYALDSGLRGLKATCSIENEASMSLFEKCGYGMSMNPEDSSMVFFYKEL